MTDSHAVILAIETSNPSLGPASVVVGRVAADGGVVILAEEALSPSGRHDDALLPAIARVCERAGAQPGSIGRVAVSVGPGGFSGLRVACATAQMIGLATGAKCVPVPTALVAAAAYFQREPGVERLVVALGGKRESAWVAGVDRADSLERQAASAAGGRALDAEGFAEALASMQPDVVLADAHLPVALGEVARAGGVPVQAPTLSARVAAFVGAALPTVEAQRMAPIYPREPEAVRKWRELGR